MLQQLSHQDHSSSEYASHEQDAQLLAPEYIFGVVKRRYLYFVIPFLLIFAIGAVVTVLLPAVYVSEGKMLIESQEIPSDLVQPTVSTLADERVQLLQQRIMVRDKLLAIANKYQLPELAKRDLFLGRWRPQMSATDIVDMMRERTQIKPLKTEMAARPGQRQFIAFTVGFENERPQVAAQVANELMTIILDEDVRARTGSALETTRFLEREVKRLDGELNSVEGKINEAKSHEARAPSAAAGAADSQLIALRTELLLKAATYSENHPDMKAIKEKIASLDKLLGKPSDGTTIATDALERQKEALKKNLEDISKKLSAARLGENLERGQHSERLSVLEQPTLPQKPVRPNRPKILAAVFAMALAAAGGLVFALETFDGTIRGVADIAKLIDSHLIAPIPYITTKSEVVRQKARRIKIAIGGSVVAVLGGLGAVIYLLQFGLL